MPESEPPLRATLLPVSEHPVRPFSHQSTGRFPGLGIPGHDGPDGPPAFPAKRASGIGRKPFPSRSRGRLRFGP